jgi:glycosyltransferase involved in cell wall biosynthesis
LDNILSNVNLVVPVHNEEAILKQEITHIVNNGDYPFKKIFLVENGSSDRSFDICKELADEYPDKVLAFKEHNKGIGYAYHRGIIEAHKVANPSEWILLSAADMPFKNTDINYFLKNDVQQNYDFAIGSKAHQDSITNYPPKRKFMSFVFFAIRRFLLGMKTQDCQGTIFIKNEFVPRFIDKITYRNYFYSTELTYHAEKESLKVLEMPIILKPEIRPSTVNPLKDGLNMLKQTFSLFKKEGRI